MNTVKALKVTFMGSAALLMSACATTATTTIERINPANCDIETTRTVQINGRVTEQESYINPNNPYSTRCGGEREVAATNLIQAQAEAARTESLYNIVAIRASREMQNPEAEGVFSQQLLALLDSEQPEIAAAARVEINSQSYTEADLRQRVARDYVITQASQLTHANGEPNYVAYGALIEAYDGENEDLRVEQPWLQSTITDILGRHNRTIEAIRADFNASQRPNTGCRKTTAGRWVCGANGPS